MLSLICLANGEKRDKNERNLHIFEFFKNNQMVVLRFYYSRIAKKMNCVFSTFIWDQFYKIYVYPNISIVCCDFLKYEKFASNCGIFSHFYHK